MMSDKPCEPAI